MSLNIKNAQTVELVRELARRTGLSQTGAVEEAVRAKLAEVDAGRGREARRAQVDRLLVELDHSLTARQKKQIRKDEEQLYDDSGLPV
ncbi:MAG: type II toxin-antitoxin system VapB family antitoxin [Mycolicibacterium cosmeticum]|nr:type II toxin-antitoxin system VapB family antitoxin [Mycolicibacterium cosmeticum]